jgi:kynurenine formamidase
MSALDPLSFVDAWSSIMQESQMIDLTHPLEEQMPVWPLLPRYYHNLWSSLDFGDPYTAYQVVMGEHTGTHADAPAHFVSTDKPACVSVEAMPLEAWHGPAAIINCHEVGPKESVLPGRVQAWEQLHGPIRAGEFVIFDFGWSRRWSVRPGDRAVVADWPGLDPSTAQLLRERGVKGVGTDTLSPEVFGAPGDPVHHILLERGIVVFENLANLEVLPPRCYLMALPLPIRGGSGSPVRAVAMVHR